MPIMAKEKKSKNILIAEDERPLAEALKAKIARAGYRVAVASDGEKALQMLSEAAYDAVILDLVMPKKDGFAVLESMKSLKTKPVVIVLTNLAQEEDRLRVLSLGAKEYFVKSNTPLSAIIEYLENIFSA